jgi:hypothetical protein
MDINQEVSPEFYFYLADGRCLKSLSDLAFALGDMEEWVLNHHVNAEKNDFSNWIENIYGDKTLAKKIRRKKDRKGILKLLAVSFEKSLKQAQKRSKKEAITEAPIEGNKAKKISTPRKKSTILKMLKTA